MYGLFFGRAELLHHFEMPGLDDIPVASHGFSLWKIHSRRTPLQVIVLHLLHGISHALIEENHLHFI